MGRLTGLLGGDTPAGVALLVDGPNCFRDEFDVDMGDLRDTAAEFGRLVITRIYFDVDAPAGLIQAAEANGFEPIVTSGDVDVRLAVDAIELTTDDQIDTIAIASRDMDFKPVLETAARRGRHTVAIAPGEFGRSDALPNVADDAVNL